MKVSGNIKTDRLRDDVTLTVRFTKLVQIETLVYTHKRDTCVYIYTHTHIYIYVFICILCMCIYWCSYVYIFQMYSVKSMPVEKHTQTCVHAVRWWHHSYSHQAGPEGKLCIGSCGSCVQARFPLKRQLTGGFAGQEGRAGAVVVAVTDPARAGPGLFTWASSIS